MGLWVHVGIHPERHGRAHAQLASDLVESAELAQRLDVEHEDLGLERVPHLVARLTDAREDNLARRESRAQRAEELAARDDVGAGARARQRGEHTEVRIRLDRVADDVGDLGEGVVVRPVALEQRRLRVHVGGRADVGSQGAQRNLLATEIEVAVREMVHRRVATIVFVRDRSIRPG